jgi:hypothetical protein
VDDCKGQVEAHSGSSLRRAKENLVLGTSKKIKVTQNNNQIVKAVSVNNSYHQKWSPEASLRSKLDIFGRFGCRKWPIFGRTFLRSCSTIDSRDFDIKLMPKYKWKRIKKTRNSQFTTHNQFNQFDRSVRQFVVFVYIEKTVDINGMTLFVACHSKIPAFVLPGEFSNDLIKKREEKWNVLLSN